MNEFLLWNAENEYTEGANYNPKKVAKERDPEGVEQDTKQQDNKDDNKKIVLKRMGTAINNKRRDDFEVISFFYEIFMRLFSY